jgi:uridylate kinase|tara:strand:- start:140 stop:862 length:723 start_codon:yes stop_codon:yes gene_type:complete
MSNLSYKRFLVKFSGESVAGKEGIGIDPKILDEMAASIKACKDLGAQISVVIGGGNLFRGEKLSKVGMDRVAGDHMGMLATVMNGIALRDALERANIKTRLMSAISMSGLVEHYDRRRAIQLLKDGYVVIFTAGTGNPFFTTDTAACLRAIETQSQIMLKATRVDGVYSEDPEKNDNAIFYEKITFNKAIGENLKVMDATALTLARDHSLPIKVFNINTKDSLKSIILGEKIGTLINESD